MATPMPVLLQSFLSCVGIRTLSLFWCEDNYNDKDSLLHPNTSFSSGILGWSEAVNSRKFAQWPENDRLPCLSYDPRGATRMGMAQVQQIHYPPTLLPSVTCGCLLQGTRSYETRRLRSRTRTPANAIRATFPPRNVNGWLMFVDYAARVMAGDQASNDLRFAFFRNLERDGPQTKTVRSDACHFPDHWPCTIKSSIRHGCWL